ncbi:MAG: alanine racemase [Chloroflexi bacterium]|nr:alanine racemase [Chloroflexota bacterium]
MTVPQGPAWLEVDLGAVRRNIAAVQQLVGPAVQVVVVVKADAYGHGLIPVGRAAQEAGAAGLGVALVEEGVRLRQAGITVPVLVMTSIPAAQAPDAVRFRLTCALCDRSLARALSAAAIQQGSRAFVEIKIDTGMGRIGIAPSEAAAFIEFCRGLPGLTIVGAFSHLSSAEDEDPSVSIEQHQRLAAVRRSLVSAGSDAIRWRWHLANSAAAVRFPESRLDAVRVGLLAYGFNPVSRLNHTGAAPLALEPAARWMTRIGFVKTAPPGTPISYGGDYVTPARMTVATLGLGYADGYPRTLSNVGEVLIDGRRCRVLGRICMDQMMVGVPAGARADSGDPVVVMGTAGSQTITAEELAGRAGTILHELLARLGSRMPRVYRGESGL